MVSPQFQSWTTVLRAEKRGPSGLRTAAQNGLANNHTKTILRVNLAKTPFPQYGI